MATILFGLTGLLVVLAAIMFPGSSQNIALLGITIFSFVNILNLTGKFSDLKGNLGAILSQRNTKTISATICVLLIAGIFFWPQ